MFSSEQETALRRIAKEEILKHEMAQSGSACTLGTVFVAGGGYLRAYDNKLGWLELGTIQP